MIRWKWITRHKKKGRTGGLSGPPVLWCGGFENSSGYFFFPCKSDKLNWKGQKATFGSMVFYIENMTYFMPSGNILFACVSAVKNDKKLSELHGYSIYAIFIYKNSERHSPFIFCPVSRRIFKQLLIKNRLCHRRIADHKANRDIGWERH